MVWCELDINNKWELRQVDETRGEDGEHAANDRHGSRKEWLQ